MTTETRIDTGTNELLCVIRDRVAIITLNRPEARNAMSDNLTPALRNMIKACGENPDVGVLLLTGAGPAFCAGGNVKGMGANRDKTKLAMSHDERVADLQERQRLLTGALVSVRKPTIAALPGPAVGAGLALAMACDMRIAAQSAFLSTGYLKVGLSGDYGIAWLLTRLVGTSRARELMFTCERVDAARCEAIGLVNRVVPGRQAARGSFRARQVDRGRTDDRDPRHEGQSRRSPDVRFCHRARPRGRANDPLPGNRGSQGSGAGLHREAQGGVQGSLSCPAGKWPGSGYRRNRARPVSPREGSRAGERRRRVSSWRREYRAVRRRFAFRNAPASSRRGWA